MTLPCGRESDEGCILVARRGTAMPLLDLLWAMIWFFLFIAWIWLLIVVFGDIIRSRDLSGWSKALWSLFIVILPLVGVLLYLIVRGSAMGERAMAEAARRDDDARRYIREAAGSPGVSIADEVDRLAQMRSAGTISDQEFQAMKARLMTGA